MRIIQNYVYNKIRMNNQKIFRVTKNNYNKNKCRLLLTKIFRQMKVSVIIIFFIENTLIPLSLKIFLFGKPIVFEIKYKSK
jgi:hypothetical protein